MEGWKGVEGLIEGWPNRGMDSWRNSWTDVAPITTQTTTNYRPERQRTPISYPPTYPPTFRASLLVSPLLLSVWRRKWEPPPVLTATLFA